ncbi:hypothetical protein BDV10DRAFT_22081 [Aspergillus recurvatus]
MPAKHRTDEDQLSKQDPTERRRLQNRLSQRNHRRKIRDRIAKLQERVIASELRAAATLHGWHSTPCIPYEVKPSPSSTTSTSSSLSLSPCSSSPTELQRQPSCNANLNAIPPLPVLSTVRYEDSGTGGLGSLTANPNASGTSSPTDLVASESVAASGMLGPETEAGTGAGAGQAFGLGLDTMQLCEQWGLQGSVYLATETSLPQILQTLGPSSNAIIVVPTPGYPVGSAGSTLGYTQGQGLDMSGCQCQTVGWMSCPLHTMG